MTADGYSNRPAELTPKKLDRIGLIVLIASAIVLGSLLSGYRGVLWLVGLAILLTLGTYKAISSLRLHRVQLLWSLRNRLFIVYTLFGVLPVLLLLTLVGLAGWALTTELAIYLATSELDRRFSSIASTTEALTKSKVEERPYVAKDLIEYFRIRFPGMCIYVEDSKGMRSYPGNAPPFDVPRGWHNVTGLIDKSNHFYVWSRVESPTGTFTAIAPIDNTNIADIVPGLGQVILAETPTEFGLTEDKKQSSETNIEWKDGAWVADGKNGQKQRFHAIRNSGHIPAATGRLDVEATFFSEYPYYVWTQPDKKQKAQLIVRSRPSAVLSTLFAQTDFFRTLLVWIIIGVALLFLAVEIGAVILGISLSRRITGSIHELYEGTRRVIRGEFKQRIPVRGKDQLADLTTSFNQMTNNLERLLSVEKEKERMQAELAIAREVQNQLYPRSAPPASGLRLTVHCEPARMVSGDYYDYECVQETKLAFAIGDVAGKGISAALLMATVQAALRAQLNNVPQENLATLTSADLVSRLNKQLYAHTAPEKYATFFFGMYDEKTSTLTYTNAGHLPPVLIRRGEALPLDVNGTVVGAFPFSHYAESHVRLEPGDLLVCFTDGITEPENAYGEMFGEDRLVDLIKRCSHEDDQTIIKKVIASVQAWHSAPELPDDMTLLIARCPQSA